MASALFGSIAGRANQCTASVAAGVNNVNQHSSSYARHGCYNTNHLFVKNIFNHLAEALCIGKKHRIDYLSFASRTASTSENHDELTFILYHANKPFELTS
jgi:hypothetical protein